MSAVGLLRCPVCEGTLLAEDARLQCERGHSFDIARQGYVALLAGRSPMVGDTVAMVDARVRFLAAGHYDPIAAAVADLIARLGGHQRRILDIGAGTGFYLSRVLDQLPDAVGIGLDVSKPAARRLARAHERAAAVVADAWQGLPVRDDSMSAVLTVFAPRNAPEIRRVLAPGGAFLVVTPTTRHLRELIGPLGMIGVDEQKDRRLDESLSGDFERVEQVPVEFTMTLHRDEVATLVGMGPSAHHVTPERRAELIELLPEPMSVTASVQLTHYRAAD
ncbi:putative RNA methyltransferase [Aldersonia kunmingensis]|uniref:putative RNA methyltransferase n=1 Tax=Aldersonia kunmingensis TaxID=408066 RepID=UPI000836E7D7|nr:methyltransferase domain-containing protein [Aldersonia kunmingensis]